MVRQRLNSVLTTFLRRPSPRTLLTLLRMPSSRTSLYFCFRESMLDMAPGGNLLSVESDEGPGVDE